MKAAQHIRSRRLRKYSARWWSWHLKKSEKNQYQNYKNKRIFGGVSFIGIGDAMSTIAEEVS